MSILPPVPAFEKDTKAVPGGAAFDVEGLGFRPAFGKDAVLTCLR
jgi:hypothetical protein